MEKKKGKGWEGMRKGGIETAYKGMEDGISETCIKGNEGKKVWDRDGRE